MCKNNTCIPGKYERFGKREATAQQSIGYQHLDREL